jgi:hypothetical protein
LYTSKQKYDESAPIQMKNKSWTFTSYENGEPAGTERGLDRSAALAAIEAAISGETRRDGTVADLESHRRESDTRELARVA